ncbi:MAG: nickel-dependent lactate racemase [Rhodothermales bacterium]
MHINIAYGRDGLDIELPDDTDIIQSKPMAGLTDEIAAIRHALQNPIGMPALTTHVKAGDRVVVTHSDITRPVPNDRILPVILQELESAGVRRKDITLLNALGTHRQQTDDELRMMLGDFIVDNYTCAQHNSFDDTNLVSLGETSLGNPVRINKMLLEADYRVYTGFIEPHFFAGFSGGPKAVLPALSGSESVLSNHGREMIADPKSAWGNIEGNPIWEEMREVALKTMPAFLLNVTINPKHEITGVFAGDLLQSHELGREFIRKNVMVGVDAPYDIIITNNNGYPLDQNLYQTVKGMSAANRVVKEGGAIIMCAACVDGLPDHGRYAELLEEGATPQGVLDMIAQPGFGEQDQWQVQIQAQIQVRADVYVYSEGLSDQQIHRALLKPCRNISETIAELKDRYGPDARICVMPDGPASIAYVA